jgi:DNA polymerase-1
MTTGQALYAELKALDQVAQKMRRDGCAWDAEAAASITAEYTAKADKARAQITRAADGFGLKNFNPGSPKQVGILYQEHFKLEPLKWNPPGENGKASPSYDEEVLTLYFGCDNPAAAEFSRKLVEWRGYDKVLGTVRSMTPRPGEDRIRGRWQAYGPPSGRWACPGSRPKDPEKYSALQVLSSVTRRLIKATPGKRMSEADLSQAELRTIALFSGEPTLLEAFARGADAYSTIGQMMFKSPEIKKGHKLRNLSKETSLASNYGSGPDTAFAQIWASEQIREQFPHLGTREVAAMQNKYFSAFPRLKEWGYEEEEACRKRGDYRCPFSGRRVKFYGPPNPNFARNLPNQAAVAWWMNRAILKIAAELRPEDTILTIVHDAICIESPDVERVRDLCHKHMEGVLEYQGRTVAMPVESKIGDTLDAVK